MKKLFLPVVVATFLMTSCAASNAESDLAGAQESAAKVCLDARAQLQTESDLSQIVIKQCEAQTNDAGEVGFVLALNDYLEWGLLETKSLEDMIFTIPLGLLAIAFAKSGVEPGVFDRILFFSNDTSQTVYDIDPKDLREVLTVEGEAEAKQALKNLRSKMEITSVD